MEWAGLVYLIDILDGIKTVSTFASVIAIIVAIITVVIYAFESSLNNPEYMSERRKDEWKHTCSAYWKVIKYSILSFFLFVPPAIFCPNEKTSYTMIGAYMTQQIVESKDAQKINSNIVKAINLKLEKYVKDLEVDGKVEKGE